MEKNIQKLHSQIANKEISVRDLAEKALSRIAEVEPKIHAFITISSDEALKRADTLDGEIASGNIRGILHGIPIAVKDNISTKGIPTTCASRILENYIPPYNATVVERLEDAGAVIVGKTNMDEFAMGSSTEHSAFGITRNPWNLELAPGGSSGGSASAVAAGCVPVALGSDTGGSIRQPASFCGIVGVKPTYGRVSRYGLVAFASSLDQIGPLARSVRDSAAVCEIIAGYDPRDSTSVSVPSNITDQIEDGVKGLVFGLAEETLGRGVEPETKDAILKSAKTLEKLGAKIEPVPMPSFEYAIATYYLIATSEASSNLARYDGVRYGVRCKDADNLEALYVRSRTDGFGNEVKRRIMLGTYALSAGYYDAYYARAQRARRLIVDDFKRAFQKVNLLITPTSPAPAFKLGERLADPLQMYLSDIFTVPANLAGIPAISLPCGKSADGVPLGIQLMGSYFEENLLFRSAYALEREIGFDYDGLAV